MQPAIDQMAIATSVAIADRGIAGHGVLLHSALGHRSQEAQDQLPVAAKVTIADRGHAV